ncbi:hypothetical protein JF55_21315 [Pseudomonas sp. 1-7]|nr:hypothetical protein JF55_21315 [Pseudomonas sp. 1-7]
MLSIFDEILHRLVNIATNRSITSQDAADTTLCTVLPLVVVATVYATLAASKVLPQLAELDSLIDISMHLVAIEVSSMDVVAPAIVPIPLLHRVDVAYEVIEDRVVLVLGNQLIQIIENVLNSQPGLRL